MVSQSCGMGPCSPGMLGSSGKPCSTDMTSVSLATAWVAAGHICHMQASLKGCAWLLRNKFYII